MTADARAALVAELSEASVKTLLAMVVVELIELREVLELPVPVEPTGCQHPDDRRRPGGMGSGVSWFCLECGYEQR